MTSVLNDFECRILSVIINGAGFYIVRVMSIIKWQVLAADIRKMTNAFVLR